MPSLDGELVFADLSRRLVPTNGMRACTASATEISYNYSDDPEQLYRAEIEFIGAADWSRELNTLLDDLLDGNGQVSRDRTTPDTEASLAYSKIKAVYPHMTKEMIASTSPAELAAAPSIQSVLGSVKRLEATTSPQLFKGLQHYVDSKERTSRMGHVMEYWRMCKSLFDKHLFFVLLYPSLMQSLSLS